MVAGIRRVRGIAGAILLGITLITVPDTGRSQAMSLLAPPHAAPLTVGTRKFSVVDNGLNLGLPQRTGYVSVIDVESVELLFILKVFDLPEPGEGPVRSDQPVPVITSMELNEAGTAILLGTDGGARYEIDLRGLTVTGLN